MKLDDAVVSADCTAVFGTTQKTVVTKWLMEDSCWDYDIMAHLQLPDGGKIVVYV